MTRQQFLEEIKQLSIAERVALIEAITRSLREDLEARPEVTAAAAQTEPQRTDIQEAGQNGLSLSQRLRGVIKFEGEPPTDEEVKEMYTDYLAEKYS
jgi:ribosomal protein L7/L12